MSVAHILYNKNTVGGSRLFNVLALLEQGLTGLVQERNAMVQMKDGDDFTRHIVSLYGFQGFDAQGVQTDGIAEATAAFGEIDSVVGKLTVDTPVSNVNAALVQLFSILR